MEVPPCPTPGNGEHETISFDSYHLALVRRDYSCGEYWSPGYTARGWRLWCRKRDSRKGVRDQKSKISESHLNLIRNGLALSDTSFLIGILAHLLNISSFLAMRTTVTFPSDILATLRSSWKTKKNPRVPLQGLCLEKSPHLGPCTAAGGQEKLTAKAISEGLAQFLVTLWRKIFVPHPLVFKD